MNKLSYNAIVIMNLYKRKAEPGDVLTLAIRNQDSSEGMYKQAQRLYTMFLQSYCFFPQSIAMHPDHLALLKKQGKTLDVMIDEQAAKQFRALVDLTSVPSRIPLIGDDTLDLFTCVARYHLDYETAGQMAIDAVMETFGRDEGQL